MKNTQMFLKQLWLLCSLVGFITSCGTPVSDNLMQDDPASPDQEQAGVTVGTTNGSARVFSSQGQPLDSGKVYIMTKADWASTIVSGNNPIIDSAWSIKGELSNVDNVDSNTYKMVILSKDEGIITQPDSGSIYTTLPANDIFGSIQIKGITPTRLWLSNSPYSTVPNDNGEFTFFDVAQGQYMLVAAVPTPQGTVYSHFKSIKIGEHAIDLGLLPTYTIGEVLLEDFELDDVNLNSLGGKRNLFWNVRTPTNSLNSFTISPILTDTGAINVGYERLPYEAHASALHGRSLQFNYTIVDSIHAKNFVILELRFRPNIQAQALDSISFWYKSSRHFELEITAYGDTLPQHRQVELPFTAQAQWTKAVISKEQIQSHITTQTIFATYEDFISRLYTIQFEFRGVSDGWFELDELRAHGLLARNLTIAP